jgi:hypothetical protein
MDPLDLTTRPPRGPREKLAGLVMLPRTLDKMRALLPGGDVGSYKIEGFSIRLLEAIGIKPEDLQAVVASAASEREVVAWVEAHADRSKADEINARLAQRSIKDVTPDRIAYIESMYPDHKKIASGLFFDIMEADDAATFGAASERERQGA